MHSIDDAVDFAIGLQPTANRAVRHHSEHVRALWLDRDLTGPKSRETGDVEIGVQARQRVKNSPRPRLYCLSSGKVRGCRSEPHFLG